MALNSKSLAAKTSLENLEEKNETSDKTFVVPNIKLNDNNEIPIIGLATRKVSTFQIQILVKTKT